MAQMTIKHSDKGANVDKVEIDLDVANVNQATVMFSVILEPTNR
jgi:hypothetical protein